MWMCVSSVSNQFHAFIQSNKLFYEEFSVPKNFFVGISCKLILLHLWSLLSVEMNIYSLMFWITRKPECSESAQKEFLTRYSNAKHIIALIEVVINRLGCSIESMGIPTRFVLWKIHSNSV